MTDRNTEVMVTFKHPFTLTSVGDTLPAGSYRIETEEQEIPGLSFVAFRRTATLLHVPAISMPSSQHRLIRIDPGELEAALEADSRTDLPR